MPGSSANPAVPWLQTANKEFEYLDKVDANLEAVYLPAANGTVDLLDLMEKFVAKGNQRCTGGGRSDIERVDAEGGPGG